MQVKNSLNNKVAKITSLFWIMKIVATTLGETLGDYLSQTLNLGYYIGLGITFVFFIVLLFIQLRTKKYIPFIFWFVIIGTTTLGTEISDFLDRTLKIGYAGGSLVLIVGLATTLFIWFKKYKNLKVDPITDRNKELYYWVAILFSNSLGTAFGDFLGDYFGLSYLQGALITGIIILMVVLLHYFSKLNTIFLFWIAFVFTRPFGATFGDFLTKPVSIGGLNLGTLNASLFSIGLMLVLIFISYQKERVKVEK